MLICGESFLIRDIQAIMKKIQHVTHLKISEFGIPAAGRLTTRTDSKLSKIAFSGEFSHDGDVS